MATPIQSSTPALPSTTDAAPYVPVSWMAVAAAVVAGLFVVLLLFFGYAAAFKDKKPLIMPSLLIFAAAGLVLSFAGRRMIRNSEGTRTGERLTDAAWWVCVVGGLGYAAYLFGIEYTIKSEAQGEVEKWVGKVLEGTEQSLGGAFYRSLDPASRGVATENDLGELTRRFPDRYVAFNQMDVVRLAKRNPGACKFEPGGMREWVTRAGLIDCVFTGVVRCPEGSFPVEIPVRGSEGVPGSGGSIRQWEIAATPAGLVQQKNVTLTPYGWRLSELEADGTDFGRAFISTVRQGQAMMPWAYQMMVRDDANQPLWAGVAFLAQSRPWGDLHNAFPALTDLLRTPMQALGVFPEYVAHRWDKFFRLPGGRLPTEGQEQTFLAVWKTSGLMPVGRGKGGLIPNNDQLDASAVVSLTDQALEVRVPCEMPALASGGERAYRARVVVACTDPSVLNELKQLRAEADPVSGTVPQPTGFRTRSAKWRVVGIESDLEGVSTTPQQGPGGGMSPGGMR